MSLSAWKRRAVASRGWLWVTRAPGPGCSCVPIALAPAVSRRPHSPGLREGASPRTQGRCWPSGAEWGRGRGRPSTDVATRAGPVQLRVVPVYPRVRGRLPRPCCVAGTGPRPHRSETQPPREALTGAAMAAGGKRSTCSHGDALSCRRGPWAPVPQATVGSTSVTRPHHTHVRGTSAALGPGVWRLPRLSQGRASAPERPPSPPSQGPRRPTRLLAPS